MQDKRRTNSDYHLHHLGGQKELNRRVFTKSALPVVDVVRLVREDIQTRVYACTNDPGDRGA